MSKTTIDLPRATISSMAGLLQRRQVSPVELVEATLERIDSLQPHLLSFTTVTAEYALTKAKQTEREIGQGRYRGSLHGIPYTLKDVIATKGIRTTFGDPKGTDYKPNESATVHTLLEEAGAILVGKVVSEIGRGQAGPVECRNPWDSTMSPGTSSSGSASAVAASMGLLSIGTDTGGSVRHPANNCGLVGLKPTFGRISRSGVWAASWSSDQAGPLTKTVEDNAIALEVLGTYDPEDLISINEPPHDYRSRLKNGIEGVRIGVPTDDWVWKDWLTEEEEDVVRRAIAVLEDLGAYISELRLPRAAEARSTSMSTAAEAPVYIFDHFTEEQMNAWPEHHEAIQRGHDQSFADYLHAVQKRAYIKQEAEAALKEVDVIAMPTGSTFGDRWDATATVIRGREVSARSRAVYRNALASICGHPALSVPCGFGMGGTLPVGLMLHGRPLEEGLLYRAAYAYEQATEWHTRYPPVNY